MDSNCVECGEAFERKSKGWKRRSCSVLFPNVAGFFCDKCFYRLKKSTSLSISDTAEKASPSTSSSPMLSPIAYSTLYALSLLAGEWDSLMVLHPASEAHAGCESVGGPRLEGERVWGLH